LGARRQNGNERKSPATPMGIGADYKVGAPLNYTAANHTTAEERVDGHPSLAPGELLQYGVGMSMLPNREIHLKSRPQGLPKESDFELVETEMAPLQDGKFLVRNAWISVDPYMRGRMKDSASYVEPFQLGAAMEGGCVGQVIASKQEGFSEGDWVLGNLGWRECWTSDGTGVSKVDPQAAPLNNYLSVLGMTGMTAYVGLFGIGNLKEGENVFVSAASGAVGSMVGQIARLKNCRVVGSAGSAEKIQWLKSEAGFDEAFNYHEGNDISLTLKKMFPDGIDLYFDNVGGDHLAGAIDNMNQAGRIVCCGMISGYNDETPQPGPSNLFKIIGKRLRIEGFIVRDHPDQQEAFLRDMSAWIQSGEIKWEETIVEGLENAPQAFIRLFSSDKLGKVLVKI